MFLSIAQDDYFVSDHHVLMTGTRMDEGSENREPLNTTLRIFTESIYHTFALCLAELSSEPYLTEE